MWALGLLALLFASNWKSVLPPHSAEAGTQGTAGRGQGSHPQPSILARGSVSCQLAQFQTLDASAGPDGAPCGLALSQLACLTAGPFACGLC